MLTSDMTEEQLAIFADREKLREDALYHTRKVIQKLVDNKMEADAKAT